MKIAKITIQEAISRFNLDNTKYDVLPNIGYNNVMVVEGDVNVASDFNNDVVTELVFENERPNGRDLVIITGNLIVNGRVNLESFTHDTCLLVVGNLECEVLRTSKGILHVSGDSMIQYALVAGGSHGITTLEGKITVPYFLHANHCANVNIEKETTSVNYFSDEFDGWDFEFDYYRKDFLNLLVDELYSNELFSVDLFVQYLKSGKPVFK